MSDHFDRQAGLWEGTVTPRTLEEAQTATLGAAFSSMMNVSKPSPPLRLVDVDELPRPWACSCGKRFAFLTTLRFHEIETAHEPAVNEGGA